MLEKVSGNVVYNLFVAFAVAVRILHIENDDDRNDLLPYAKKFFAAFVHNSRKICGKSFVTFNVHNFILLMNHMDFEPLLSKLERQYIMSLRRLGYMIIIE